MFDSTFWITTLDWLAHLFLGVTLILLLMAFDDPLGVGIVVLMAGMFVSLMLAAFCGAFAACARAVVEMHEEIASGAE